MKEFKEIVLFGILFFTLVIGLPIAVVTGQQKRTKTKYESLGYKLVRYEPRLYEEDLVILEKDGKHYSVIHEIVFPIEQCVNNAEHSVEVSWVDEYDIYTLPTK